LWAHTSRVWCVIFFPRCSFFFLRPFVCRGCSSCTPRRALFLFWFGAGWTVVTLVTVSSPFFYVNTLVKKDPLSLLSQRFFLFCANLPPAVDDLSGGDGGLFFILILFRLPSFMFFFLPQDEPEPLFFFDQCFFASLNESPRSKPPPSTWMVPFFLPRSCFLFPFQLSNVKVCSHPSWGFFPVPFTC